VAGGDVPVSAPLGVWLQGLVFGSLTGLFALGLVLVYRTNRIVNFAYGAMGGVGASLGVLLYRQAHWPWFLAVAVAVATGVVVGATVDAMVIRRLVHAPRIVLTVATIGLVQVLGGIEVLLPGWFGASPIVPGFDTPLSALRVRVEPVILTGDDIAVIVIVPMVVAALGWFLLATDTGMALRGIADNPDRARLLGIPARRLSMLAWAIIGGLAALSVCLRAPGDGLTIDAAAGPTTLLPALAAAVLARMRSLPVAFASGLALGELEALVRWNVERQSVTTVAFFAVILVALLLQRPVAGRAEDPEESVLALGTDWRPLADPLRSRTAVRALRLVGPTAAAIGVIWFGTAAGPSSLQRATVSLVLAIVALSLVALTGWGGTVSLGQSAIFGVGGVTAANLIAKANLDLFLVILASAGAGAVVAVLVGLPALRVRGLFLAVTTLAFAVAADAFFFNPTNFPGWLPGSFQRPVLWKRVDLGGDRAMYFFVLGALGVALFWVRNLRRARPGRVLIATRDNPRAAAAMGVPVVRDRVIGFTISGVLAGIAGALHATVLRGVGFHSYDPTASLLVLSMVVIGGIGSIGGGLLGVGLVQLVAYLFPRVQLLLTGAGVLVALLAFPGGLAQLLERIRDRAVGRFAREQPSGGSPTAAGRTPTAPGPVVAATVPGSADDALIRLSGVEASYGSLQVLFGIDFSVAPGEMVALLGTNGAGKSTVLRVLTGLLPASAGSIELAGRSVRGQPTEKIASSGVAMVPGGRGVFPTMTVAENLRLATWQLRRDRSAAAAARAEALRMFPRLADRLDLQAGDLSGGEQQMLSLAMAFVTRPRLLCIDELSLGLAPAVVADLCETVREIHRRGTTVVVVEQSVTVAASLADRAVFLEKGEVRYCGATAELLERPDVLRSVFLRDAAARVRVAAPHGSKSATALACRGVRKAFGGLRVLDDVELDVAAGSVVGLIGHNGAGKTTLFDVLSGFLTPDAGRVLLGGRDVTDCPPHVRAGLGLGRSFQEARLFPSLTVEEALLVALDRHLPTRDPLAAAFALPAATVPEAHARARVDSLVELLGLERYRLHRTSELSTGTRRIVELACVLAQEPAVMLLDEPSAGVAQREVEALAPLLRQVQAATGATLLLIEHDLGLLQEACDELVAIEQGRVIARGRPAEVLSNERVLASYLGSEPGSLPLSSRSRRSRPKQSSFSAP
jgi:ABC-type branched-subunit amino acid transport system ATPase component/ABC-type branched-subunit amino acid transport system permease subunit